MSQTPSTVVTLPEANLQLLLHHIEETNRNWERAGNVRPWFRGQADAGEPLLPSVFRAAYDEFWMTSTFRLKALAFGPTPETNRLDQWLFLMQHYGLPTRLLDWTESPLLAAFFSVAHWLDSEKPEENCRDPHMAVWMLQPIELNKPSGFNTFPNTWTGNHHGSETFRMAFHPPEQYAALNPSTYPLAVQASAVDRRVAVQQSCFTIHSRDQRDLETILADTPLAGGGYFRKFILPRAEAPKLFQELDSVGISFSTVFPDLPGLAKQFKFRFGPKPTHKRCAGPAP